MKKFTIRLFRCHPSSAACNVVPCLVPLGTRDGHSHAIDELLFLEATELTQPSQGPQPLARPDEVRLQPLAFGAVASI
jgi:hypothetical protein